MTMNLLTLLSDFILHWLNIPMHTVEFIWVHSRIYRRRLQIVKIFWLFGLNLMLFAPNLASIAGGALFLTFVSFAYLEPDEAEIKALLHNSKIF